MKRFIQLIKKSIKKMPLLYMILAAWGVLSAVALFTGRVSDDLYTTPAFAKALTRDVADETDFAEYAAAEGDAAVQEIPEEPGGSVAEASGEEQANSGESFAGPVDEVIDDVTDELTQEPSDEEPTEEPAEEPADELTGESAEGQNEGISEEQNAPSADAEVVAVGNVVYESYTPSDVTSRYYSDPGLIPLTTEYDYIQEDYSYFDDALVIGDSRMVGLRDYSMMKDHAVFAVMTGLTVYNALTENIVKDPETGKEVNAEYLLKNYTYGKVYICVGINELGIGNTSYFADHFGEILSVIRSYQPDAIIFIQSIMAVSARKSESDDVFNNININDKNAAIAQFADGEHIFYLNINEFFTDQCYTPHSGALLTELTTDQVHVYGRYYARWAEVLLSYGV